MTTLCPWGRRTKNFEEINPTEEEKLYIVKRMLSSDYEGSNWLKSIGIKPNTARKWRRKHQATGFVSKSSNGRPPDLLDEDLRFFANQIREFYQVKGEYPSELEAQGFLRARANFRAKERWRSSS